MTIVVDQLEFSYGRMRVLSGVTARASRGRITAVIGPNAAGKSTLLRCLIGALRPQRGEVRLDEMTVHKLSARQMAQHAAYVPQRSIVSAAFTVRQVVELGRFALSANASRVEDAIRRLDLLDVADRVYHHLSVGQQQRVTLARALAQVEPRGVLILDEPMSAMDLRHVAMSVKLLRDLANGGATIVLAMHDLSLAASMADEVWLLDGGRLVAAGPASDVLSLDRLQSVFGVPFCWVSGPDGRHLLPASSETQYAVQ
jgi:iron complex transport system ATP-binding protein